MKFDCQVKKGVSKSGNEYIYLSILIGTYEKRVFLEKAEEELLRIALQNNPQK